MKPLPAALSQIGNHGPVARGNGMTLAGAGGMEAAPHAAAPAPLPGWAAATFSDIDEQAAALQGWNQEYLQLSRGRFRGGVQRLQLGGFGLFVEDLPLAVHQTGCVRPGVVALGVPLLLQGDSTFCGQPGNAGALHVFSGSAGFEFRSPQRHVMLGIEASADCFDAEVFDGSSGSAAAFAAQARLVNPPAAAAQALRQFLVDLFATAAERPAALSGEAAQRAAQHQLTQRLAALLAPVPARTAAAPCGFGQGPTAAQRMLVERARQLVGQRLSEPPGVGELCSLLGVSRRTLQASFQSVWGLAPLAWLNTLRLNAVRRQLKTAASVTDAATRFGFWHFGHFANDYRSLFGETPSQTLRRHRAATRTH